MADSEAFFRERAAMLFIFSAVLLPFILLTPNVLLTGLFVAAFILLQISLLSLFYRQEEHFFEEWYVFWAVIAGLVFMLAMLVIGRSLLMEFIAFFLLVGYLISVIIFVMKDSFVAAGSKIGKLFERKSMKEKSEHIEPDISDDDIIKFREKDELDKLIDEFEIPNPKKSTLSEQEKMEFTDKKQTILEEFEEAEDFFPGAGSREEIITEKQMPDEGKVIYRREESGDDDSEDYVVNIVKPKKESERKADLLPMFKDYFDKDHSFPGENEKEAKREIRDIKSRQEIEALYGKEPEEAEEETEKEENNYSEKAIVRELYEIPAINFEKTKESLEALDSGVRTLSEKIKLITEKAIKEGELKKERQKLQKRKQVELIVKDSKVFASKTGEKYHYDRNCIALKRVSKKHIFVFPDHKEARKRGLRACGLCKK